MVSTAWRDAVSETRKTLKCIILDGAQLGEPRNRSNFAHVPNATEFERLLNTCGHDYKVSQESISSRKKEKRGKSFACADYSPQIRKTKKNTACAAGPD